MPTIEHQVTSKSPSHTTTTTTTTTTFTTTTPPNSKPQPRPGLEPRSTPHQPATTTTTKPTPPPPSIPNQTITIRHAKFTDLWPAAHTLAQAFTTDPLFGTILHPNRHLHPTHPALWFYTRLLTDWFDPSQAFLLATTPSHITGVAQWTRMGPRPSLLSHSWAHPVYDPRYYLYPTLRFLVRHVVAPVLRRLNRALSPERDDLLESADRCVAHYWSGPRAESFYLHFLAVHPRYQNRGVGRRLVEWGMRRASDEKVSVSVIAAEGKDMFYHRCGFEVYVGNASDGEGNPMGVLGVPGGNIWFKDWVSDRDGKGEGEGEGVGSRQREKGVVDVLRV